MQSMVSGADLSTQQSSYPSLILSFIGRELQWKNRDLYIPTLYPSTDAIFPSSLYEVLSISNQELVEEGKEVVGEGDEGEC